MKKLHLSLGVSLSALLLAACGGDASEAGSEPAANVDAPAEVTAGTPAEADASSAPAADDIATIDGTTLADFIGDAESGENVFIQCKACHVVEPGVNRMGPSLAGIIGSQAGAVEGFNYSDANANSGITWTQEKMFQYLENPRRVVPGTRMAYSGLKDGQERADLIAYLQVN